MSYLFAVGITVGLLAGVWVYLSGVMGLIGFCGLFGMGQLFCRRGRAEGCKIRLLHKYERGFVGICNDCCL